MATITGFFRDGDNRVRPITSRLKKPLKQYIIPVSKVRLPTPTFAKRPLFFQDGTTVQLGVLDKQSGEIEKPVPIAEIHAKDLSRSYDSSHAHSTALQRRFTKAGAPDMTPAKLWQRRAIAQKFSGGTVLELFAGKGHLSKQVWAPKANKLVMVDKNQDFLKQAEKEVKHKPHEIVKMNNLKWLDKVLPEEQIRNLKVVDFDAFGSPAESMRKFFDNHEIDKRMLIAVTDGSCIYMKVGDRVKTREFCKRNYGVQLDGTRLAQVKALDKLMLNLGQRHGFKVEPINAAYGRQTVYAGYKITPK